MSTHHKPIYYFRAIAVLVALAMCLTPIASHSFVAAQSEIPQIVSPEVIHTGTGPTGYTVTFRYWDGNPATHNVKIRGEWYFSDAAHTTRTTSAGWLPSQWIPGAFPIAFPNSGAAANWPIHPMTQDPDTLIWSFTTPMPSGTYTYGFLRNCTNADFGSSAGCATSTQIADPSNPPWNTSGAVEPTSQVYVPSDPAFGTPDLSWEAPNPVPGTLLDVTYPSPQSTNPVGYHYLAVYLPPSYDPNRVPAYPTLYLSHGAGGNEVDWSTQGVANRIVDNLIAAGKVQPMVVVMTNFNGISGGTAGYRTDVVNNVIPYVEANYNVSHNASDRAFGGLSAGGQRANDILFNATTAFGYVASWSIGSGGAPAITNPLWNNPDLKTRLGIIIGGGRFDSITVPGIDTYEANLTAKGIPFVDDRMDAGHEWYAWRQLLYNYALTTTFKRTFTTVPPSIQYSDPLKAVVSLGSTSVAALTGSVEFFINGVSVGSAPVDATGAASLLVMPLLAPGDYSLSAKFTSASPYFNDSSTGPVTLTVSPEDARAYYNGNGLFWTSSMNSTSANVTLSAAILDATALPPTYPAYDPNAGDIRNAKVTFINRDTNTAFTGCTDLPVGLVNAGDLKTGIATCNTTLTADKTSGASQYTVGIVVSGYYTRNSTDDDTIITVAQPIPSNFITGGGHLVLSNSAGFVPGTAGSKANFGFNVKYTKSGANLQGNVNLMVRSDGHVYKIKGTAIASLGVKDTTANFSGKANITDVTDPLNPISVDGNATLQLWMTDNGDAGTSDTLGIQVLSKNGGMWFSSNWSGTKTVEQTLGGGNLSVH